MRGRTTLDGESREKVTQGVPSDETKKKWRSLTRSK